MNRLRNYHTSRNKSKTNIDMISLICEILKKCKLTYLQNRNRDIENKLKVTKGEREVGGDTL